MYAIVFHLSLPKKTFFPDYTGLATQNFAILLWIYKKKNAGRTDVLKLYYILVAQQNLDAKYEFCFIATALHIENQYGTGL